MSESGFFRKDENELHEEPEHDRRSFDPGEAPGKTRIEKFRAIVKDRSVMCIEGQPVDLFSASTVVAVYDALTKPENRHTLMSPISILRVIDIALRVSSRARTRAA